MLCRFQAKLSSFQYCSRWPTLWRFIVYRSNVSDGESSPSSSISHPDHFSSNFCSQPSLFLNPSKFRIAPGCALAKLGPRPPRLTHPSCARLSPRNPCRCLLSVTVILNVKTKIQIQMDISAAVKVSIERIRRKFKAAKMGCNASCGLLTPGHGPKSLGMLAIMIFMVPQL